MDYGNGNVLFCASWTSNIRLGNILTHNSRSHEIFEHFFYSRWNIPMKCVIKRSTFGFILNLPNCVYCFIFHLVWFIPYELDCKQYFQIEVDVTSHFQRWRLNRFFQIFTWNLFWMRLEFEKKIVYFSKNLLSEKICCSKRTKTEFQVKFRKKQCSMVSTSSHFNLLIHSPGEFDWRVMEVVEITILVWFWRFNTFDRIFC